MDGIVFVNGEFVAADEAKISVFDRGFLFGDGIYEVAPVIRGQLVDKVPFLARLERSLGEIDLAWPCSKDAYVAMHEDLIARNDLDEGYVYSQITRGIAPRDFGYPQGVAPSWMAFAQAKPIFENPLAKSGVKVASVDDIRWKRRDIKSIALLGQCVAKQAAVDKQAYEGWMVEDGYVTEGTSSSAYIVKDGVVITRPLSNAILPGIRRQALLRLAAEHQIKVQERLFTIQEAYDADEAFLSNATTSVLPIIEIDGRPVGDGVPGPVARRFRQMYLDAALAQLDG